MNTWIKVARYHMVDRLTYLGLPWAILAFVFVINVIIAAAIPVSASTEIHVGGLASFYSVILAAGVLSTTRSLPFGLAVGVSRRSYYLGTASLAVALAVLYGLGLTVLQIIERASDGWGVNLYFFRVTYLLNGPVVSDVAHLVRRTGPHICLRQLVRPHVPPVENGRAGNVYRRPDRRVARRGAHRHLGGRLAQRRPLLHHPQRCRADGYARGSDGRSPGGRIVGHPPGDRLTAVRESRGSCSAGRGGPGSRTPPAPRPGPPPR